MVEYQDARVQRRDLVDETEPVDDEARVEAVEVRGELVRRVVRLVSEAYYLLAYLLACLLLSYLMRRVLVVRGEVTEGRLRVDPVHGAAAHLSNQVRW